MLEIRVYDNVVLWCNLESGVFFVTTEKDAQKNEIFRPISRAKYIRLADKFDRLGKKFMMAQAFDMLGTMTVVAPNGRIDNAAFNQYLGSYTSHINYDGGATVYYRMNETEFKVAQYIDEKNREIGAEMQRAKDAGETFSVPTISLREAAESTGVTEEDIKMAFKRLESLEFPAYLELAVVS